MRRGLREVHHRCRDEPHVTHIGDGQRHSELVVVHQVVVPFFDAALRRLDTVAIVRAQKRRGPSAFGELAVEVVQRAFGQTRFGHGFHRLLAHDCSSFPKPQRPRHALAEARPLLLLGSRLRFRLRLSRRMAGGFLRSGLFGFLLRLLQHLLRAIGAAVRVSGATARSTASVARPVVRLSAMLNEMEPA